jgi:HlyD family secretion protein
LKLCLLGLLALVLASGCGKKEEAGRPTKGGGRPQTITIHTTGIQRISLQRQVDLAGTLISPDQARVSSEVAGVVRQVLIDLGQEVARGQILVQLEPRELEIALRRAESQLHQTEAQLGINGTTIKDPPPDEEIAMVRTAIANRDDARAQLTRAKRLRSQNLLSQADLDTTETRVKVTEAAYQTALENVQGLKANLQERRAAYELAQKKLDDAVIRSPVSGTVSERLVHPGEYIRENTPVVSLVQMNPLKLRTGIQERHAGLIRPGLSVEFRVESFPEETFSGRVVNVSPAVDQGTRTFVVEVLVDNPGRKLKPGFFAKGVVYTSRDDNVLAVPEGAISTLAGVSAVFVVEGSKVRQQVVSPGARERDLVEIRDGLKGDEMIATTNLSQLATGVSVKVGGEARPEPSGAGQGPAKAQEGDR